MLVTFPKAFSQAATFQGYLPKLKLPNSAISQAATSQACQSLCARPLAHPSIRARPPVQPAVPQKT